MCMHVYIYICRLLSIKLFISRPGMQGCGWGPVAGLMALGEARIDVPYSSGVLAADGFGSSRQGWNLRTGP